MLLLVLKAAWAKERAKETGSRYTVDASMAKLYASETADEPFNADVADGIESDGEFTSFTVENINTAVIPVWLFRVAEE